MFELTNQIAYQAKNHLYTYTHSIIIIMYKYVCTCTYVCISTCINVLTFHFDQSDCLIYVVLDTYMHI